MTAVRRLRGHGGRFWDDAERVERAEDLPAAVDRALARRPALLDVVVSPEAVSSDGRSGLAWVPDLQPLAPWNDAERRWRQEPPGRDARRERMSRATDLSGVPGPFGFRRRAEQARGAGDGWGRPA